MSGTKASQQLFRHSRALLTQSTVVDGSIAVDTRSPLGMIKNDLTCPRIFCILTGSQQGSLKKAEQYIIREERVKIDIEGTLLKMTPETGKEKEDLAKLWNTVISCIKDNKKLVPVGQYTPGLKEVAMFNIE